MSTFHIGYFGKLPARADFVKGGAQHELTGLIDEWLAGMMNQLTTNPRWKQHYDAVQPLHFAFVGPRNHVAVAGHLAASNDQAGRRYPFIVAGTLEVPQPESFLAMSAFALAPLWQQLGTLADEVLVAADPAVPLQALSRAVLGADAGGDSHAAALERFAAGTDMATLEALLAYGSHGEPASSVRGIVLGIGLLLQPFGWTGRTELDRALALPLPGAPEHRPAVAAFWLALIAPFLRGAAIELALFHAEVGGRPMLVVGFSGASAGALQAVIDPEAAAARLIGFDDTAWVDGMIAGDPAVQRLSACLAQGSLSLGAALGLFHETFA
ncbi:type VI secretion system-associated protein TagF [Pseudoduganella albidiflava]|uniref:Type VI secretion system-associated protein TagF n=1 Tax=Pseudoduganella albidiflava TaxID=321983 RepID=A0A411WUS2_9BURK|nr:type VI secretion system-associated protein TagF [Pseudoduganella albidiflava]QBI00506.1 type VI secretion system-associated protein TagF [Pseudoduganella albidiflava]GGY32775.1 type VI secretion-associated protein [Pseudoduganella albidiflava]